MPPIFNITMCGPFSIFNYGFWNSRNSKRVINWSVTLTGQRRSRNSKVTIKSSLTHTGQSKGKCEQSYGSLNVLVENEPWEFLSMKSASFGEGRIQFNFWPNSVGATEIRVLVFYLLPPQFWLDSTTSQLSSLGHIYIWSQFWPSLC